MKHECRDCGWSGKTKGINCPACDSDALIELEPDGNIVRSEIDDKGDN